ncbi:MAG: flagellar basal body rod protein [Proteobacteria bacterium]|nr:flagellar basal body rod protein [Pseudomonadota bacterium]
MQPMQLFNLAFRQNEWLAQRQSVISSNIANANTPGYKAKDVESFDAAMRTSVPMAATSAQHFSSPEFDAVSNQDNGDGQAEVLVSGNDVSLEQEFLKSNDVMRSYSLNTQIMKTFDRMLQSVTKG